MSEPDLADLDAFAAVAVARSFRGAASRRGVSPSSLSEALRRLETRIGVRLLNRTTRSVTLTEAGERLLERLRPALSDIASALDAVNGFRDSPIGTLRLNVPTIVGRLILPPLVGRFLSRHPGLTLEVVCEDAFIDVLAAGFDAGVRYDESLERDMIAVPIGPRRQRFITAAAPGYLDAHGRPTHPRDLLRHACVRHRFAGGAIAGWEFERAGETIKIRPEGPLIAASIELELAAAIQGLGLICSFDGLLVDAIATGALEPVLEDWSVHFNGPFLYYHGRRHLPAPLRAFVDFLREEQRVKPADAGHRPLE